MTKPISPKDMDRVEVERVPAEMIEAANELITEKWDGHSARFKLKDLGARARAKMGMDPGAEFKTGQLDIEPTFRKAGWSVEFDKPGYNESYDAYFLFRRKK